MRLGLAAWGYPHLVGPLYPPGTPSRRFLGLYAQVYPFVEVDALHYAWPRKASLEAWAAQTPEGFQFIPKMHRSLTHGVGPALGDAADWWSSLAPLHGRVPAVVLQFPPSYTRGRDHEDHVASMVEALPVPAVIEFRHPSWSHEAVRDWMSGLGAVPAWALLDGVPMAEHAHPGTGYLRIIGDRAIPKEQMGMLRRDRREDLERLRDAVGGQSWERCFVVMTAHFEGCAPLSLARLARVWGLPEPDVAAIRRPAGQRSLF